MKKVLIVLCIIFFNFQSVFAYNFESIYKKIDVIYNKNPKKLEKINKKLKYFLSNTKKESIKSILIKINKYINYKLKNEDFYNQKISKELKEKIENINNNSFTDQIKLEKLYKLLENGKYSFIEKEFINFSILNSKVVILLNHQNFAKAKEITIKFFKNNGKLNTNKILFLLKNINYSDFSILVQLAYWFNGDVDKIINYRIKYFPDEKYTAYNMVRRYGYKGLNCEKLTIKDINLDLVGKKFCKLLNNKFETKDLEDLEKLNNNLQNLSDRANYYSYVSRIKGYKNMMLEKNKLIGEKILKADKNFVNGYIILLDYYNNKNDCDNYKKYLDLLEKNYIGDKLRKNYIFSYRKIERCYFIINK